MSILLHVIIITGQDPEHSNMGGGIECPRHELSGASRKGGEYERGRPPQMKNLGNSGAGEVFLSLFLVKMSAFKLNFESHFDILYAIFCFNFSLYWCCSWHTKKTKGNDQDLTKYLINDCSSYWIMRVCVLVYGLQTMLSLIAQSVPCPAPTPKN